MRRGTRLGTGSVRFGFDGREYVGREGDTAASALLAAGVRAFGRSMKYRRLRGVVSAGVEDPGALLTLGRGATRIPNLPAPALLLREGMELYSQNRWPALHRDVASLLQFGGGLFGAGFYYKTFLWPSWRAFERPIRALAGLGPAPGASVLPDARVEHLSCDVLVAGGGAAGLCAALAAARCGATVVLVERDSTLGGELQFETATLDGLPARQWIEETRAGLVRLGVRLLVGTRCVGGSDGLHIAHGEPGRPDEAATVYRIRARAMVIALGAVERPIAFVDNDRPGVMLLGAAERFQAGWGALAGRAAVVFANHDRAWLAAERLLAAGVPLRAVVDVRGSAGPRASVSRDRLEAAGVDCLAGHVVTAAGGRAGVASVEVATRAGGRPRRIDCEFVFVSGGWSPSIHPGLQQGGGRRYDSAQSAFVAEPSAGRWIVGNAAATWSIAGVAAEGHACGAAVAGSLGFGAAAGEPPRADGDPEPGLEACWRVPCEPRDEHRQFVDPQNDVTVADLRAALAEGFIDVEHVKRYTALGFGTDQGRLGGTLGAAILAELRGQPLAEVGISRPRPPYHPVTLRSLAGLRTGPALRVARRTVLHEWHAANGGILDPMGLWYRPRYYRANGADAARAAVVEARRVRGHGGVLDGSTLGKIEVCGPDAAAFLDAAYLTRASTLRPGRARYMVCLREDGVVLDDGLALCLEPGRYVVTTSSSHGEHVLSHLEHLRELEWAARGVILTDVTDAWAVIVVAGPASRDALVGVLGGEWVSTLVALPHMGLARGRHLGHELTLLRAGFSGELAYELHARPAAAPALWQALVAAGLAPYGLDALDILRVEKGYLTTSEINGETTPHDLGMDALLRAGQPCVGRELLDRPGLHAAARPRLVGLRAVDGRSPFLAGAQLTVGARDARPCGYVTSACHSVALDQPVGLALVAREIAEGAELHVRDPLRNSQGRVRVCAPVHFDPDGTRMKA